MSARRALWGRGEHAGGAAGPRGRGGAWQRRRARPPAGRSASLAERVLPLTRCALAARCLRSRPAPADQTLHQVLWPRYPNGVEYMLDEGVGMLE